MDEIAEAGSAGAPRGKEVNRCANCGSALNGRWCSQCGQKALSDQDRRVGQLVAQFAHELLHVDGKLVRTLRALVLQPGQPSKAYLDGQRVRYLSPIGLFLLVNLLYFIAPPMSDFNLDLYDQYFLQPYSSLIQPLVDARLEGRGVDFDTYGQEYGQLNLNLARSLIILHLPMLTLALWLLFPGKGRYYADHFIVVTHLFTFLLLVALATQPLLRLLWWVGEAGFGADWSGVLRVLWAGMPLLIASHWLFSLKLCYRVGWARALLSTLALALATVISHFIFRLLQFLAVFALT